MDFTYEGSGTLTIGGCSAYELSYFVNYDFSIGSAVYNKHKALKGVYEKIVIKDVRFPKYYASFKGTRMCRSCNLSPLYVDTLNGFWSEEELVAYSTATELIEDYLEQRAILAEEAALRCLR